MQTTLQGLGVASYGQPASVVGNTNQDVVQLLALVNAEADSLAHERDWMAQQIQYLFTAVYYSYTGTTASGSTSITGMSSIVGISANPTYFMVTGTYIPQDTFVTAAAGSTVTMNQAATGSGSQTLTFSQVKFEPPTDFDRQIDRTQWDKSKHWEMLGPETPQQREWLKSGYISTGPRIRYWWMGGYFTIWPALGTTESLGFEYVSKYWVRATAPTTLAPTKQAFSVDTDTCIFSDALMRSLIKLKYWEIKGFDTAAFYRDYMMQKDIAKSADAGNGTLSMAPRISEVLIGWENIPDSGYGA